MKLFRFYTIILFLTAASSNYAQQPDTLLNKLQQLPSKYYTQVDKKLNSINKKLTAKSVRYLARFHRHEKMLLDKLGKTDSHAVAAFTNADEDYNKLSRQIKSKVAKATEAGSPYNSYIDTLSTSLSFLKKFTIGPNVTKPMESLADLQSKLQQSEKIKEFIAQRKQQIKDVLSKYTKLPAGLKSEYTKLNKTAFYYTAQVNEYKEMLKDPKKAERKALSLLNKLPAFQKFMKKNGMLASLFRMPENDDISQSLAGLQTRASVQTLMQQQIAAGGPNAQQVIQQNIAQAHSELNKLKDKINKFGGGNSEINMPDFKPNSQKTKSFFKRLEYGTNVQFEKSNSLLPSASNIGLSFGYKLNDKNIVGVGISYKMGMGTIKHIVISHEGIGLRSFADYKIKGSIFFSGGYEMNYNAQFKNIEQLKQFNDWQSSGLIGLSKKYNVSKKMKGEMKLLFDFLANEHRPVTQPVVFRLGYLF